MINAETAAEPSRVHGEPRISPMTAPSGCIDPTPNNRRNGELVEKGKELAMTILRDLDGMVTCKLRELKPQLKQLRDIFRQLKGRKILGCETWEQFCSQKLHRTASAVRKLLAETPEQAAGRRKSAGKTPAPLVDYLDRAKKQLRHVLGTGASVKEIQETLVCVAESLFPSRQIVIEVREIEVPCPGQVEEDAAIVNGEVDF